MMNDKEKIENCYRQMYQGMVNKDREMLDAVLDGTFVLVHMTGMWQSKSAFIRAIEDGTLNYYSVVHQRMEANICNNTAEFVGQSLVGAAVFGGGRHTWRLQLKLKLVKNTDAWKITEARASVY